jgi:hypothetical protein
MYSFVVEAAGLSAKMRDGGVVFEQHGRTVAAMPPGVAFEDLGGGGIGESTPVTYRLVEDRPGRYRLTVSISQDWLGAPSRRFPVVIDPATTDSQQAINDDTWVLQNLTGLRDTLDGA